jgi:hypothetical protein
MRRHRSRRRPARRQLCLLPFQTRPRGDRGRPPGLAGAETSFANGGQISVSHAEPWANPSAPLKVLQWLGKEDAPLLFRMRADMRQWLWGLQFLRECTPARTRHNIEQIVRLGTYSRDTLQQLRRDTGIAVRRAHPGHPALLHQRQGV